MENENIVPVKTGSLRIYRRGCETCVVDLEYGRSMVLNETEKAVFKLCSGEASIKRIAAALNLSSDSAAKIIKRFMEHRLIASYAAEADEDRCFLSSPYQTLVCDCKDFNNSGGDAAEQWGEKLDRLRGSAGNCAEKILFIRNLDLHKQAERLAGLLERYAEPFSADRGGDAPFKIVCEIFSLPEPADFIGGGVLGADNGAERRLSAVGRLWCLFHRFGAQLILVGSADFWQSGFQDTGKAGVLRQELNTGSLDMPARCAETAAMLYETSLRIWNFPESEGGRHFMPGLSIMPAVLAVDDSWDECVRFLADCGYRTMGVRFARELLEEGYLHSETFRRTFAELLDFIRESSARGRSLAVFPFERWRRIVRGSWPRCKSRRSLEKEYEAEGDKFPLACRRCPSWYYCLASEHYQEPLPCRALKALTERALWNI